MTDTTRSIYKTEQINVVALVAWLAQAADDLGLSVATDGSDAVSQLIARARQHDRNEYVEVRILRAGRR